MEYSYYGRMDGAMPKRNKTVAYYMFDETVKKIIEKNQSWFEKELKDMLKQFKQDALSELKNMRNDLRIMKDEIKKLQKKKKTKKCNLDAEKEEIKLKLKARGYKVDT